MRKIIAITHVSLDGIMQSPGGADEDPAGGFTHGGWIMPFGDEVMGGALEEIMSGEFDLLLGRRTYEIFAAYWPFADPGNFIAKAFNQSTKYVATNSRDTFDWEPAQRVSGDVIDAVRRLKETGGPDLHTWGSSTLLQALIDAELVDEFRTWIYPVILGKGKRLFEPGVPAQAFTLVDTKTTSTGVMLNTYRPVGPIPAE